MKKPLLVVVDDWEALEVYEGRLDPHFELELAPFGAEGLRMARESKPRRILLDLTFEDMSPAEAIEALRADPRTSGVPLTVIFGRAEEPFAREGVFPLRGDHGLRRPYEAPELIRLLNEGGGD